MYELFEDEGIPKYPVVKLGQVDFIKRTYEREVYRVIDYYASRVSKVNNDHILNRLIVTGCPAIGYDLLRFKHLANIRAPILADNFRFIFSENYGTVKKGLFYGGAMELIFFDDEDFDEEYVYKNWRDIDSVKVLSHPFTDYKLIPPFGQEYTDRPGLLVSLSINISKLFVQYKGFVDSRLHLNDEERIGIGSAHFLKMHVLPNILKSHVDFIMYNRLKNMFYVLQSYDANGRLPFAIMDYSNISDVISSEYRKRYEDKPLHYAQFLQNYPAIFKDNILEVLKMPDLAKTKQVYWALFLTRLEDMFFLMHLLGDSGYKNNRRYIEKMIYDCKWFLRDNTFKSVVSSSIYNGYLSDMKEVGNMV